MNRPWIYMYSPSWSPHPPPTPLHPSGSFQCTSPEHLSHASNLGWWSVSPLIINKYRCCSLKTSTLAFTHRVQKVCFKQSTCCTWISEIGALLSNSPDNNPLVSRGAERGYRGLFPLILKTFKEQPVFSISWLIPAFCRPGASKSWNTKNSMGRMSWFLSKVHVGEDIGVVNFFAKRKKT